MGKLNLALKLTLFLILINTQVLSYSLNKDSNQKYNLNFIGFLPSKHKEINGLAIGIIGSEVYCDYKTSKISNGINLQIGQGILLVPILFMSKNELYKKENKYIDSLVIQADTSYYKAKHNGFILSIFGTATDKINGLSFSGLISVNKILKGLSITIIGANYYKLNGVSISLINKSILTNGLQIGVYNSSVKLNGIQLGLWNKNNNRSFPIINW